MSRRTPRWHRFRVEEHVVRVDQRHDHEEGLALRGCRGQVLDGALGARLGAITIPVNGKGYRALKAWAQSMGPVQAFGIEGTGSYGAGLSRFLCEHGHTVLEVNRPNRQLRR